MASTTPLRPVLVYDQIASNRRRTWLLLLSGIISLPSLFFWAPYALVLSFAVAMTAVAGLGAPLHVSVSVGAGIGVFLVVMLPFVVYRQAASIALRVAGARSLSGSDAPDLSRAVQNLCLVAGIPTPALYVVESSAPNAFSLGASPGDSALVVTRGLLSLLDRVETEGVVAHELSHIGNEDTRLGTLIAAQVTLLWLPWRFLSRMVGGAFRLLAGVSRIAAVGCALYLGVPLVFSVVAPFLLWREDPLFALIQLLGMVSVAYSFFGAPIAATVIGRAVWREREHLADANAFLLTRRPDGLATALARLDQAASFAGDPAATALEHLYIVDPTPSRWEGWRFTATHPPLEERLNRIAAMGGGAPTAVLERAMAAAEAVGESAREGHEILPEPEANPGPSDPGLPAAPAAVKALRLLAPTPLLANPDAGAPVLETVPTGELVVVLNQLDDFYEVLSDERFGFIARSAPSEPFDTSRIFPASEQVPADDDRQESERYRR